MDNGVPELVEAMDGGALPVASAALVAAVPHDQQREVLSAGLPHDRLSQQAVRKAIRQVRSIRHRTDLRR